jgi:protein SCO1/2
MQNRPQLSRVDRIVRIAVYAFALLSLAVGGAMVAWKAEIDRWAANTIAGIGGPFELITQQGKPFTRDDLLGRPHILYFGFTFCPDLCPTTLFQLARIVQGLGGKAAALRVVFITVDPERDSVPVMNEYISAFHEDFIGLTGSPAAIALAAKAYRIYYGKVELDGGGYTIDHTASAMLFNADGSYADSIGYNETDASARAKIERLIAANIPH